MQIRGAFLVTLVMASVAAQAIVWRADRSPTRMTAGITTSIKPVGVLAHSGARTDAGSAVLIEDDMIVTAGHMLPPPGTTTTFRIGGKTYATTGWTLHPRFTKPTAPFDLAVGRLTERVTNVSPANLFNGAPSANQQVLMIGCGGSGPLGAPLAWDWIPLTGTNTVSSVNNSFIRTSFDRPSSRRVTELESHLVPGDSGGALLMEQMGDWRLAAIAVGRSGAKYGATSTFVRLHSAMEWLSIQKNGFGRVEFQLLPENFQGSLNTLPASVELTDASSDVVVAEVSGFLNPRGEISLRTEARGTFGARVWVKGRLSRWIPAVSLTGGLLAAQSLSLISGDVNNDNQISDEDVATVQAALAATQSSWNWNADADVDGDGNVSLADLEIVLANIGRTGE